LDRACTITHRAPASTLDEYGNAVDVDTTTTTVCELQQQQRRESDASSQGARAGDVVTTVWLLVLPAATAIDAGDKVTVDGVKFEVDGLPWAARNPRTRIESHVEATLRRTVGSSE